MNKMYKSKREEGFTIIEVLIVLAIAGLIILIVFLAVPALQRNSRNTSYRNEGASLLAAANEWVTNSNGSIPAAANATDIKANAKLKNITTLTVKAAASTPVQETLPSDFKTAFLVTGAKCGSFTNDNTHTPASSSGRSMVLIYPTEKNDGTVLAQCTEG